MGKEEFLADLYQFMHNRGQPITKIPSLGYQELDLFLLYKLVLARGGMDEVTRKQEWKLVYQDLNIPTMSTSASYNTRTNYKKYLYLYELEHCDFSDLNRPRDAVPKYQIGEYIRIVSSVFEGQVFYAQILKNRYKDGMYNYYVHYNGWNSSHDEWMREDVLDPLLPEERRHPESLPNPPASRSSKSNHLIYDPSVSDRVIQNLMKEKEGAVSPKKQTPLSPSSPASAKKPGRKPLSASAIVFNNNNFSTTSEEEDAANELMELEYFSSLANQSRSRHESPVKAAPVYRPAPSVSYPMRADPGESIAKILEDKRDRPHEQDLIHRNRLHSHILTQNFQDDETERQAVAQLLSTIKLKVEREQLLASEPKKRDLLQVPKNVKSSSERTPVSKEALNDPRTVEDIQESLINLQSSLLSMQSQYKHAMKVLKKHHNITSLPPPQPAQRKSISTRKSANN